MTSAPDGERIFIIGFFIFSIIGLFLILRNFEQGLMWEAAIKERKLRRRKSTVIPAPPLLQQI